MLFHQLIIEQDEGVAVVVLNRPDKLNALSPSLLEELSTVLSALDSDPQTRVIVITGSGEKSFCSGFDISEIKNTGEPGKPAQGAELIENAYRQVRQVGKPVLAMINGLAIGAGCDLITNCDLRFAVDEAIFALPPARLGIVYSWEGTQRVMRLVGAANAKDMFMSGRSLNAAEALAFGLLNRVFPRDQLREATISYAKAMIKCAPLSVWGAKRTIDILTEIVPSGSRMKELQQVQARVWGSEDARDGALAFLEKRKPLFHGR